jgi:antitoxin SocA-like protein
MATTKRAPITPLRPKPDKIIAAVCYLIQSAEKQGLQITQYDIVKSLFLADKAHLNRYGRPITFDNYTAMENGPVPSTSYNFLKRDNYSMKTFGIKDFPWKSALAPNISKQAEVFTLKAQDVSFDALSESDIEELSGAFVRVKELGFGKIRALTHEDPAYLAAFHEPSGREE